ncbi:Aurora kinase [Monocercomonoides exilis]|uniref:Aurora kinase n=1 Tax=Monocercomonoides exilis TaxID=2049356 RepID=UPI003559C9B1|nr:Aurora kinase [Monocercomonoides exilis]
MEQRRKWKLSDFEIGMQIGKGQYGSVYVVREKSTKFVCALKRMKKDELLKRGVEFVAIREISAMILMNHPNIVKYYDYFTDEHNIFLLMEYLPYGDFYALLRKYRKFPEPVAAKYLYQIASALNYLHSKNMMHRDLKPENILIGKNGELKLTDFGCAANEMDKGRMTVIGTPDYIPPEMLLKQPYTHKCDCWSLGVLICEMLFSSCPFTNKGGGVSVERIKKAQYTFPWAISPEAEDLIGNLLKIKGEDRLEMKEVMAHPFIVENTTEEFRRLFSGQTISKAAESSEMDKEEDEGEIKHNCAKVDERDHTYDLHKQEHQSCSSKSVGTTDSLTESRKFVSDARMKMEIEEKKDFGKATETSASHSCKMDIEDEKGFSQLSDYASAHFTQQTVTPSFSSSSFASTHSLPISSTQQQCSPSVPTMPSVCSSTSAHLNTQQKTGLISAPVYHVSSPSPHANFVPHSASSSLSSSSNPSASSSSSTLPRHLLISTHDTSSSSSPQTSTEAIHSSISSFQYPLQHSISSPPRFIPRLAQSPLPTMHNFSSYQPFTSNAAHKHISSQFSHPENVPELSTNTVAGKSKLTNLPF